MDKMLLSTLTVSLSVQSTKCDTCPRTLPSLKFCAARRPGFECLAKLDGLDRSVSQGCAYQ